MKIVFQIRPDYITVPAGDTVQLLYTASELRKLGHEIHISSDPNLLLSAYDLVHIFNITRIKESYLFFRNAQGQKKIIIISPIYWNPRHYLEQRTGRAQNLALWNLMQPMRARLIKECDLLLPNGELEMQAIRYDFPDYAPYAVVPNGFPDFFINTDSASIRKKFPHLPETFILCAARISQRKNQLWLAEACQELNLPLILVGPVNDKKYFTRLTSCRNVTYLGLLQGDVLASAYAAAHVHALPSWFETPGLSSLEAGACGTTVLSTNQGSVKEYFQDLAVYVNPLQKDSMQIGLETALNWSPQPLTQHIRKSYPWSQIALLTNNMYEKLLSHNPLI